MTNMPEVKLAREAELCYACVAMVTDYDSWQPNHGAVKITDIITVLTTTRIRRAIWCNACPPYWPAPTACAQRAATTRLTMPF